MRGVCRLTGFVEQMPLFSVRIEASSELVRFNETIDQKHQLIHAHVDVHAVLLIGIVGLREIVAVLMANRSTGQSLKRERVGEVFSERHAQPIGATAITACQSRICLSITMRYLEWMQIRTLRGDS